MAFLNISFKSSRQSAAAEAAVTNTPLTAVLELTERRRTLRPLPVPDAVELEMDSGWALWQESVLESNPPRH